MLINDTDNQPTDADPDAVTGLVLQPLRDQYGLPIINLTPGKYLIGSSDECDCRIALDGIGESHCELEIGPAGCSVVAIDPRTWVNNRAVEWVELQQGDRLVIGPVEYEVDFQNDPTGQVTDHQENSAQAQQQLHRLEQLVKQAETSREHATHSEENVVHASESTSRLQPGPWQRQLPQQNHAVEQIAQSSDVVQDSSWRDDLEQQISRLTSEIENQQQNLLGMLQQQNLTVTEVAERQRAVDNAEQRILDAEHKMELLQELLQDVQQHAGVLLKRESRMLSVAEQERARIARQESDQTIHAVTLREKQSTVQNWERDRLEQFAQRHEELNQREATLQADRDAFAEQCRTREQELADTETELAQQRSEIEETRQDVTTRMVRLDQLEIEVRNREEANQHQWEQNQQALQQRETELNDLKAELDGRQTALESRLAGMAQWEAELLEKQQRTMEDKKQFLDKKQELSTLESQLNEQLQEQETRQQEFETRQHDLNLRETNLQELESALRERENHWETRNRELEEREQAYQQQLADLETRSANTDASANAELEQRWNDLETREAELARTQEELADQQEELEQLRSELEKRQQHLTDDTTVADDQTNAGQKIDELRQQWAGEQEQLQQQLDQKALELKQVQQDQDNQLTSLQQQLEQMQAEQAEAQQLQAELDQQRTELATREEQLAQDREALQMERRQVEELQTELQQTQANASESEETDDKTHRSPALQFSDNSLGTAEKLSELKQDYTEDDNDEVYLHCLSDTNSEDEPTNEATAENEEIPNDLLQTEVEFKLNNQDEPNQDAVTDAVADAETESADSSNQVEGSPEAERETETESETTVSEKDPGSELREALADMFDIPADQVEAAAQQDVSDDEQPDTESVVDDSEQSALPKSPAELTEEELHLQFDQEDADRPELPLPAEEHSQESDVPLSSMLSSILQSDTAEQPGHLNEDQPKQQPAEGVTQLPYEPVQAAASESAPAAEQETQTEESDSIAAYMEKLLERSRNNTGTQPEVKPAAQPVAEEEPATETVVEQSQIVEDEPQTVAEDNTEAEQPAKPTRRPVDREATRANIDSLRQVANLSARSAIEVHAWKRLKGRLLGQGVLTTICVSSSAAFLISSQIWQRSSHFTYGCVLLGIGALAGFELAKSVMLLHKLRSKRNDALRDDDCEDANTSTADQFSEMFNTES